MSANNPQDLRRNELEERTERLLDGPLKHVRAAALAAALLPLASVAAAPASAQAVDCASGGICGFVWSDTNNNGVQDAGEPAIPGAVVTLDGVVTFTDGEGFYSFPVLDPGTYTIAVQIPPGTQPSPTDVGGDDALDSDGTSDGLGNSVGTVTFAGGVDVNTDFGFNTPSVEQPGTGTPGYWKNHPEAWPVENITVGGVSYTKAQAIAWLNNVGKDKTTTMFSSLVPAKLNLLIGNDGSCAASTIVLADAWMAAYGPVGSNVHASSFAWKVGEPHHRLLDNYNNGMLCAPHRD